MNLHAYKISYYTLNIALFSRCWIYLNRFEMQIVSLYSPMTSLQFQLKNIRIFWTWTITKSKQNDQMGQMLLLNCWNNTINNASITTQCYAILMWIKISQVKSICRRISFSLSWKRPMEIQKILRKKPKNQNGVENGKKIGWYEFNGLN